jgi:hypothetical protein
VKHASFAEKITVVVSTNVVALLRETNHCMKRDSGSANLKFMLAALKLKKACASILTPYQETKT